MDFLITDIIVFPDRRKVVASEGHFNCIHFTFVSLVVAIELT